MKLSFEVVLDPGVLYLGDAELEGREEVAAGLDPDGGLRERHDLAVCARPTSARCSRGVHAVRTGEELAGTGFSVGDFQGGEGRGVS